MENFRYVGICREIAIQEPRTTKDRFSRKVNNKYHCRMYYQKQFSLLSRIIEDCGSPSSTNGYLLVDKNCVARFCFRTCIRDTHKCRHGAPESMSITNPWNKMSKDSLHRNRVFSFTP